MTIAVENGHARGLTRGQRSPPATRGADVCSTGATRGHDGSTDHRTMLGTQRYYGELFETAGVTRADRVDSRRFAFTATDE